MISLWRKTDRETAVPLSVMLKEQWVTFVYKNAKETDSDKKEILIQHYAYSTVVLP